MKSAYPIAAADIANQFMGFWGKDFIQNVRRIGVIGFRGLELFVCNTEAVPLVELKETLKQFGMGVSAIGTTHMMRQDNLTLSASDETIRKAAVLRLKTYVDLASEFGSVVSVGKSRGNIGSDPFGLERLAGSLREVAKYASDKGITVVIEQQNSSQIDNLNTVDETLRFLDYCDESNIKFHADTLHIAVTEPSFGSAFSKIGNRLGFVHLSDSNRLVPGQGDLDMEEAIRAIEAIGYKGCGSYEVKQSPDSATTAKMCFDFQRRRGC